MTTVNKIDMKCGVCGATSTHRVLMSTNSIGSPDLDLRPAGMHRDTIGMWMKECPHCGYVARNLREKSGISRDFLESDRYLTCDGIEFNSRLSPGFYRRHLILDETGDIEGSFFNLIQCSWTCDDADDTENAKNMRKLAVQKSDEIISRTDDPEDKSTILVIRADLLRRIGEFAQVRREYMDLILGDETFDNIITFQILKANLKDDGRYTIEDALEDK